MRRTSGFSLVELMVVVALVAILAAIAVPNFRDVIRTNRTTGAANELVAMMQIARMEAVRRRARVVFCASADGGSCGGTSWARSIVFVDADRNGQRNGAEELVKDLALASNAMTLTSSTRLGAAGHRLGFGPDGYAVVGGGSQGGVSVCSAGVPGQNAHDVTVVVSRISVSRRAAGSGCAALND